MMMGMAWRLQLYDDGHGMEATMMMGMAWRLQ